MKRNLISLLLLIVIFSCADDDQNIGQPTLEINSETSVKPDSMLTLEVTVSAPGLLADNGIEGSITNGEGDLTRISLQGVGTSNGNAIFDFTAGSTENTSSTIRITATDQAGQTNFSELEISITSLEIKQVLVLNEGNFFSGNGSIDLFDIRQGVSDMSAYPANATVQQAVAYGENIYLVTNAPDRLDVLDQDLQLVSSIDQGFDNPIDFAAIGDQGFVSNWGDINTAFTENPDSYIAIVDLPSNTIIDSVELTVRPQGLIAHEGSLFIANEGGASVTVLDPDALTMTDVAVSSGPSDFVVDGFGSIWVLCTSGNLIEIDPTNLSTGASMDNLITNGFNEKMAIDGTGELIYFLGGTNDSFTGLTTVYRADLNAMEVTPFVENGFALYGIGVNPESNQIYVGDSNAFQSTGTGFVYDATGGKLDEFATGIGPKGFVFR